MVNNIKITLLSEDEYVQYKPLVPQIERWWWLKDKYCNSLYSVCCVYGDGFVKPDNCDYANGIRPALRMNLTNQKSLNPGDKIRIGSKLFTVLSWEGTELFALCDDIIAIKAFDSHKNIWSASKLKQWLNTDGLKLIF